MNARWIRCALLTSAALVVTSSATVTAADAASAGEAVVAPSTTRYGAAGDGRLWLPAGDGSVAVLDAANLATIATLSIVEPGQIPAPEAVVVGPEGIWVAVPSRRAVQLLDPASGETLRHIDTDSQVYAMALDGDDLWAVDFATGRVQRIDRATGEAYVASARVPSATSVVAGEGSVWVTSNSGSVSRIDPASLDIGVAVPVDGRPHNATFGFGSVWTANGRGQSVSRVDPATETVAATIELPSIAYDIEAAGDSIWVTTGPTDGCEEGSFVVRIDPATDTVVESIPFTCAWALVSDGQQLWVQGTNEGVNVMTRIDPST